MEREDRPITQDRQIGGGGIEAYLLLGVRQGEIAGSDRGLGTIDLVDPAQAVEHRLDEGRADRIRMRRDWGN